jgi:hypothetical protein
LPRNCRKDAATAPLRIAGARCDYRRVLPAPTRLLPLVLVGLVVAACGSAGSADRKLALVDADELAARVCAAVAIASPCDTQAVSVRRLTRDRWVVTLEGPEGVECDALRLSTFNVSALRGVARVPCQQRHR